MAARRARNKKGKIVETFTHGDDSRRNIPTAEHEPLVEDNVRSPIQVAYERRNRDLDPQLVWRGKDKQDESDLYVQAPPLYIQEKVQPKVLIDDLIKLSGKEDTQASQLDMFSDFNGIPEGADKTEFYQHDSNWTNRMILGDSLQVMASLSEREGLRGKVQCIYIDPPYGIKFNSNFQWSTTSNEVKDGNSAHITREPEQVKAFRDIWRDGVHTYLAYLRDRLTVARDLLTESGSVFVQISDENVHRVRSMMDEVFGSDNHVATIRIRKKTMPLGAKFLEEMFDFVVWYAKDSSSLKYRSLFIQKNYVDDFHWRNYEDDYGFRHKLSAKDLKEGFKIPRNGKRFRLVSLWPASFSETAVYPVEFRGKQWLPSKGQCYPTSRENMERLARANHLEVEGQYLRKVLYEEGSNFSELTSNWDDTIGARDKKYVVETSPTVMQRCILMTTDPGDLVLDPTCGSGTAAYVAEQWGRRWITIDTSRIALALSRARIMGARYPYYLLTGSSDGQAKEAELTRSVLSETPAYGNIRHGFVYERVPHITLRIIANNTEIDIIWEQYQEMLEPVREKLNDVLAESWQEWEIPREIEQYWSAEAKALHKEWWEYRIRRQKEIEASIVAKSDFEYLYDKPYEDNRKVRVAGPFTVESISPFRSVDLDENDQMITNGRGENGAGSEHADFAETILENLRTAGVHQAHKEDRIAFTSLVPWPGDLVCAEGKYVEGEKDNGTERRAAVFIGPEFGTVSRADLVEAAREAVDSGFDALVACAFNFEAHTTEFDKLGSVPVLKARMNADLHMADELKNTGSGNLFVIFGETDIDVLDNPNGQINVRLNGVDVFHPASGKVISDNSDGVACWFVDTDYDNESFFVRHAYFQGAQDQYKALKTTLKAEINEEAWATLHSNESRPFDKPAGGRIAVKVINNLGDEVMKVFRV